MPAARLGDAPVRTTEIFVASLRAGIGDDALETRRSDTPRYALHEVSVPPKRPPGRITPDGPNNNPATDFRDLGAIEFDGLAAMTAELDASARALGAPGEVMVFVHGYKNSFDHGLKRIAELDTDYDAPIAKILFDWPSDDALLNYAHDLDSAAFSRDGLERLIEGLADGGFRRIVLVGYSMGADIIVETLRQMRIGGKDEALSKIGGVVMIAPDLDVALFAQNAKRIAPLPVPFTVYSSRTDWPLRSLQRFVYADRPRLGTIEDLSPISHLPITVVTVAASGSVAEATHLASAALPVIEAANARGIDIAEFGPLARTLPDAKVTVVGRAVRVDLP